MLTDDETIHAILSATEHSRIPPLASVQAICTRLLSAETEAETLRRNNDVLRADMLDVMRDRDEARAEWLPLSEEIEALRNDLEKAESRGFERGVREAKEAAWRAWTASGDVGETGGKMYNAILALLEPSLSTEDKPE
jgi:uncharacterized coiled-coil DUF342 family protein